MRKKILIAEDDPDIRETLQELLEVGYEIVFAADGCEAINLLCKESFDLVMTDLKMPVKDGEAILKLARNSDNNSNVPILVISAYITDQVRDRFGDQAGVSFLEKPYTLTEVEEAVQKMLAA